MKGEAIVHVEGISYQVVYDYESKLILQIFTEKEVIKELPEPIMVKIYEQLWIGWGY